MTVIPFTAVRPRPECAAEVAAVPYDVVNTAEARALAAGNAKSFLHVSRPEIDMPDGADCSSPEAYAQARKALTEMRTSGVLCTDDAPHLYAYRQTMGAHVQTGIVAGLSTKDYDDGVLKRHEKTRADKEDDRTQHILSLGAHTGPVFLTYRDAAPIDACVALVTAQKPEVDFTAADGIRHQVWTFPDAVSQELVALFAAVPVAYIADGHHRAAAAARAAREKGGAYATFMGVLFPASQLNILAYNRLVLDLNGLSAADVLAKARTQFAVTPAADGVPAAPRHARVFVENAWYDFAWTVPADADPVSALDVSVLQDRFLAPVLGIDDPRRSPRIAFMGGIRGIDALRDRVTSGAAALAISVYPVTVDQMMAIADAGAVMPPKSTWFEPKLRSGLFVHCID